MRLSIKRCFALARYRGFGKAGRGRLARLAEEVALIRATGLFDEKWYRETYPDVRRSGLRPIEHYLMIGAPEGRNPHPLFDTGFYARQMARRMAARGKT